MPMQLNNINFELMRELEMSKKKLEITINALRVIADNSDFQHIAEKTLKEIKAI